MKLSKSVSSVWYLSENPTKRAAADAVVPRVTFNKIHNPIILTSEKFIRDLIENRWKITPVLMYMMTLRPTEFDEVSDIHYFDVVFSQPTPDYPIPQASATVTFKVKIQHLEMRQLWKMVSVTFRPEGFYGELDVQYLRLTRDMVRFALKLKYKFFQRLANYDF